MSNFFGNLSLTLSDTERGQKRFYNLPLIPSFVRRGGKGGRIAIRPYTGNHGELPLQRQFRIEGRLN